MIKRIFKTVMIAISSVIVLYMIICQMLFRTPFAPLWMPLKLVKYIFTYQIANYEINKENDIIESENYEKNTEALEKFLKEYYGQAIYELTTWKYIGRRKRWLADSEFDVYLPFADGKIFVESENQAIHNHIDIVNDKKFQHLYSEWVKKQVGIEDSNVEFGFAGNFDNPYIEFDKITSLSDDYREIFENTHNLYVWQCRVVNIKDLNENNKVEIAKMVREKYLSKAMSITGITKDLSKNYRGHIKLSNSNFDSDNNLKYELSYNAKDEKANLQEYIVGVGWVSYE